MIKTEVFEFNGKVKLSYLLTTPEGVDYKTEKLPLVVFLHGAGERGTDTDKLLVYGVPKLFTTTNKYRAISLSPQCPIGETFLMHIETLKALIDKVIEEYNVDVSKISCTGLSMGGFGTFELAMQYPQVFCAIAPCCGGGMEWRAGFLRSMPVWIFHGVLDTAVPPTHSVDMAKAIENAGGDVKLSLYPDLQHNCWNRAYEEEDVCAWLLEQKK